MKIIKQLKQINDYQFVPMNRIQLDLFDWLYLPMVVAVIIGGLKN